MYLWSGPEPLEADIVVVVCNSLDIAFVGSERIVREEPNE